MTNTTARRLKIYYHSITGSGTEIPRIILQGHWLEDLGYRIGDHVTVTPSDDHIEIALSVSDDNTITA